MVQIPPPKPLPDRLHIFSNGLVMGTSVELNGEPVRATSVTFEANANEGYTTVTIEVQGATLVFEGDVRLVSSEPTEEPDDRQLSDPSDEPDDRRIIEADDDHIRHFPEEN